MKHTMRLRVVMEHHGQKSTVGELAMDQRGRIHFQYDQSWLANGFDLSPQTLPFTDKVERSPEPQEFDGLPGVFNDSLPDGWGLLLMDRALLEMAGWQRHEISPLDRLAYIGSRGMGALIYEPPLSMPAAPQTVDIAAMARSANEVLEGRTPEVLQQLQIQGGSPGGARPKLTVALSKNNKTCLSGFEKLPPEYSHWLIKFKAQEDPPDMGRIELSYAQMASRAGLEMPVCQLLTVTNEGNTNDYFAVQRFDREGERRHHIVSLSGYIYADHRIPSLGYDTVIKATLQITRSKAEAEKAFRLMIFNVLTHNKDDHAKNFAYIYRPTGWALAPAFDLTFSTGINNHHTTDIAGSGNPSLPDIERVAQDCGIKNWRDILTHVLSAVEQWNDIASRNGVSSVARRQIDDEMKKIRQRCT